MDTASSRPVRKAGPAEGRCSPSKRRGTLASVGHHGILADEKLTVQGAADFLGLALRTVYLKVERGELRSERLGQQCRIRRDELERYVENARVQPGDLAHRTRRSRPGAGIAAPGEAPTPTPGSPASCRTTTALRSCIAGS